MRKFAKHTQSRHDVGKETPASAGNPSDASNILAHSVLLQHIVCTCNEDNPTAAGRHAVQLLLQPPQDTVGLNKDIYKLLLSSSPIGGESRLIRWKEVHLAVPR
jgi:hypothetical protein